MKLKKFFEERLKMRRSGGKQSCNVLAARQASIAAGNCSARIDGLDCRCEACLRAGCEQRLYASAPASVGSRQDYPVSAAGGERRDRCPQWVIGGDAVTGGGACGPDRSRRTCCSTIAETSETEAELISPEQYYTVPRCRSRIKTNPWIPTPHSITCRDSVPRFCRRQSDSGTGESSGFNFCRHSPAELGIRDDPQMCDGFACRESRYLHSRGCRDQIRMSLNDDDYYDWHDTLREAFTAVSRGDSISSADDTSVYHSECPTREPGASRMAYEPGSEESEDSIISVLPLGRLLEQDSCDIAEPPLCSSSEVTGFDSPPQRVKLADRVQRLREYKSVLNEKIRLARIECQLILSGLPPEAGCSDEEDAR